MPLLISPRFSNVSRPAFSLVASACKTIWGKDSSYHEACLNARLDFQVFLRKWPKLPGSPWDSVVVLSPTPKPAPVLGTEVHRDLFANRRQEERWINMIARHSPQESSKMNPRLRRVKTEAGIPKGLSPNPLRNAEGYWLNRFV